MPRYLPMARLDVEKLIQSRTHPFLMFTSGSAVKPWLTKNRGTSQQPGIIFLTMQELFEKINEVSDEKVVEISLSYLEIYNETIRDLLVPGGSKQVLALREDSNQTVSVTGLSSHHPKNVRQTMLDVEAKLTNSGPRSHGHDCAR
jgi:hypothetical protein